jgi:hypothetical protein
MGLAKLMVGLSTHRLHALATELGAQGVEDLPTSVITEIVMDRLAGHHNPMEWVMSRIPAAELEGFK